MTGSEGADPARYERVLTGTTFPRYGKVKFITFIKMEITSLTPTVISTLKKRPQLSIDYTYIINAS